MILEGRRAPQWHVLREVLQGGARGGRDELGAGDARLPADRRDHIGGGRAGVVLDVGRDLHAAGGRQPQAERLDVVVAQARGDLPGGVERGVDLDVERDQRRAGGGERGGGGGGGGRADGRAPDAHP